MSNNILIVEDEDSIRKFIKINLDRAGYNVFEASTGEDGLMIADNEKIDIVVLDVMLPGIDGFGVCKSLREKYSNLGIIMLTAKSQDVDKIMGLEYGTDDYMTKPFNPT
jgi:two-component system alkaline phosphatase synthesis response regulator PhoP